MKPLRLALGLTAALLVGTIACDSDELGTEGHGKAAGRRKQGGRVGGLIRPSMMYAWVRETGVELRGAGVDESPHCYKRLPEVLEHHKKSIRILHTLRPIGVAMAGENEFDPYKD